MADALVELALSTAPPSITHAALQISSSTFSTFTREPTSISSHHATTTIIPGGLTHAVNGDWLGGNYMRAVSQFPKRDEKLLRGIRLGIGFGAAAFAILLIGAVYVGIRCCRKKPLDEEDSSSMEISGVQYEMREEYGPKPMSRCTTCGSDAARAEGSLRSASRMSWGERPTSEDDVIEGERKREVAREIEETTHVIHPV
ncbi:hypothetical protein BB8028_0003g12960 [Beauveria bassiana]|uniref:Uncharacterized protein n=2 Tax=Beauveria bassiana TaxID=176275 RepID=A0A0A2VYQ6_BEABA|nr:hypothetical protein BBAD15_g1515 [Beauveria bassiana D1-5]PQK12681.1 hypothetical protein BB8028_0003g12960 [Beauveria bassiana]